MTPPPRLAPRPSPLETPRATSTTRPLGPPSHASFRARFALTRLDAPPTRSALSATCSSLPPALDRAAARERSTLLEEGGGTLRRDARPLREPRLDTARDDPWREELALHLRPSILVPPAPPVSPVASPLPPELWRAVEQLVSRLRVGRSREGAIVELRVTLEGREVDVSLLEVSEGIVLRTGDPDLDGRLERELAQRGVAVHTSA